MKHHLVFGDRDGEGFISLRTAAENEIVLNDKSGEEKIQIYDMNNSQWMEIDVPGKIITIQTDEGDILIKAKAT